VLEGLKKESLLKESRRRRVDSTHVLGLMARMSELECIRETLRLAMEEIAEGPALRGASGRNGGGLGLEAGEPTTNFITAIETQRAIRHGGRCGRF
jgi:hypothetical protein